MKLYGLKLKYLVAGIASSESEVNSTCWSAYPTRSFDAIFPWCILYGGWMDQQRYVQFLLGGGEGGWKSGAHVKSCRGCLQLPLFDRVSCDWMLQVTI